MPDVRDVGAVKDQNSKVGKIEMSCSGENIGLENGMKRI